MKSLSLKTLYASQVALNATLAIAAFCVFAIDLAVPHGYTIWMLYLPVCVGVAWSERPREAIVACALATALIMIAMVFTFERAPSLSTITSRSLGILTIWLSVSLVLLRQRTASAIRDAFRRASEANDRLSGIIINNSEDAIVCINAHHQITLFNQGAERMFGYSVDEALGQDLSMLLPAGVVKRHRSLVDAFSDSAAQSRRMGERGTVAGRRRDGTEFPAEITISKVATTEGMTFTAILRDISERVNAERVSRDQRQRLSLAMLAGRMGTFDFDQSEGLVRVDETTLRLLQLPLTETKLPYSIFFDRMHPDDRKAVLVALEQARRDGKEFRIEYRLQLEDGTTRWLAGRGFGELDAHGSPRRIMGVTYDITERINSDRAISESEALNRSTLQALPAQIVVLDTTGRILSANEAHIDFIHAHVAGDASSPIGSNYFELLPRLLAAKTMSDEAEVGIRSVLSGTQKACSFEYAIPGKDGACWLLMTAVPLKYDDTAGVVISHVDISQRKQAEALLADANRALEARVEERTASLREEIKRREDAQAALLRSQKLQAVGELAGGMAHDFNNLLTVITGYLELLSLRQLDERSHTLLKRADDAAKMGARLASRLLVIGRRHRLDPVTLDLNDIARSMIDVLKRTLGDQIDIRTHLAEGLWPTLADLSEVENAILNLAINARDAMPDGGLIEVTTGNQTFGSDDVAGEAGLKAGDYVMLSVRDTGTGIAPENLSRVFEPYFSTKDAGRGTGLGLSTIYGFAKQSGGHVAIFSEIGKGTRVSLFLPRSASLVQPPVSRHLKELPAAGECILVVEDNPDVREIAVKRLDLLGYAVLTAENGTKAIDVLKKTPGIQLVFSDVVMPGGMSGFDVAAWVMGNRPEVRVLLTSGFTGDVAPRGGAQVSDTTPLLKKPYSLPELARAVREALS